MRRFLVFVGFYLTCLALTLGQEEIEDVLSNELREMVRNDAALEEIQARWAASRKGTSTTRETCTISVKGNETRIGDSVTYKIIGLGSETAHIEEDPLISARVKCGGVEIYNEEKKRSELKNVTVKDGRLYLFEKLPNGMMTYVYLKDADNIVLEDVLMENLPTFDPEQKYAAPFVADSGNFDCNNCQFLNNTGGEMAGALVLSGSANVDIKEGDFYGNQGTTIGAVHLLDRAKLDIKRSYVEENVGNVVGGIMVDGRAMIIAKNILLQENEAKEQATSIYVAEKAIAVLDEIQLVGRGYDEKYRDYLLSPDPSNHAINEDDLARTSALKMAGKSIVIVKDANFSENAAKYGAVLVAEEAVLSMRTCHFEKNAAINGAGVYIEGGRGGYARVMNSAFVSNVARYGGALVSAGNGSFVVDECHFESNVAFRGGVLYGDYSNEDSLVANGTCSRTSIGSRMTIQQSTFTGNMAVHSGGAFFVKCTEIFANESTFTGNMAQSNGGAMYVAEAHSLDFLNCVFKENSAGDNGGSLYVKNAHDIMSTNTVFIDNSANLNSDAFASLTGDDSHSNNINITHDDTRNGGALYAEDVSDLIFRRCIFRKNSAGGIGGSVFVNKSNDIMITDTVFLKNTADLEGGAIASMSGNSISLTDVSITRNSAKDGGAVFSFDTKKIQSQQCDLRRNVAVKGGALSMHNLDELYLEDVDLSSNVAEKAGGAVRAYNGKKATIKNVIVTDIKSGSGSLALEKIDTVLVSDIDFHDNIAEGACGALEVDRALDATLRNLIVRRNVAAFQGGGVCLTNSETAKIQNVEFYDNTAGNGGGALLLDGSTEVFLNNTYFADNVGALQGGAIKGKGVKSLLIIFSILERNEAQLRGGAIYLENSSLDIEDCRVTKNYVGPPRLKKNKEAETVETLKTESEKTEKGKETADVAAKEQPETDDPNERIVSANRVLATDAGGVICVSKGDYFKSVGTKYTYNEAQSVGGAVMIESVKLVDIQFDKYLNGTAAMSGGCIYGSGIGNFSMWDTTMTYCEASNGGGFILEGNSHFTGGYNKFINNTATNGGAFLCKGDSHVTIGDTAFRYNAAKEGATLSVDCRCDVDVDNSAFFRDKKLKGNGDFFHVTRGCGSVNHNGCEFHGKMPSNGVNALWAEVGGGFLALIVVFVVVIVLARRCSKRRGPPAGVAGTGTSDPLLAGNRRAAAHSSESGSFEETESEEGDSARSDKEAPVLDLYPSKRYSPERYGPLTDSDSY